MNPQKIPGTRLKRAAIAGVATAHVGVKHITYLGRKKFSATDENSRQNVHEKEIGRILINAFTQLRGTALKVAQMMSMELDMLPEGIRLELAKACSQVTPLNRAHIRKVFLAEFGRAPEAMFSTFENTAFAAASLGQVHKASGEAGEVLAVKIQYPGIARSIRSDVQLVRGIMKSLSISTSFLPRHEIVDAVLSDIQKQLENEVDYQQEAGNTNWFGEHLTLPGIHVPAVYRQYSGARVLTTEYVHGQHVEQWLQGQPCQAQRDQYGQLLFDLFCFQLHELKVLHADPHPGNFIFCDDNTISLIDFGCVHKLTADFPATVTRLFTRDPVQLHQTYIDLGVTSPELAYEQFEKELLPIISELIEWMTTPFLDEEYDFSKMKPVPEKKFSQIKSAAGFIDDMRQDQVFFDRTFFGLLSMLRKLGARISTKGLLSAHRE